MWPTLRRVAALAGHTKVRQLLSRVLEDGHDFCCWHFSDVLRQSSDVRCLGLNRPKSAAPEGRLLTLSSHVPRHSAASCCPKDDVGEHKPDTLRAHSVDGGSLQQQAADWQSRPLRPVPLAMARSRRLLLHATAMIEPSGTSSK